MREESLVTASRSAAKSGSGRCSWASGRNWRAVAVASVALVALTRRVAAQSDEVLDLYPYKGCFVDKHGEDRAMEHMSIIPDLTLEHCAMICMEEGYAYAGLEWQIECFCGNSYDKWGDSTSCDMYLAAEPTVEAGGDWALSVYGLPEVLDVNSNSAAAVAASDGGSDIITAATSLSDLGAVESGKRAFTVVNECSQDVRVGSTGGRITFGSGTDPESKDNCDAWGLSATYNTGPMGIGCYWDFPEEESGNTDRMLSPGQAFRYYLHETDSDVRWSGTIWGSTGCDKIAGCATGVCYSPSTDYICPAYVGPGGPTTKAEFTLSETGKDYYDISAIDGTNLPMMIEPDNPIFPNSTDQNIMKYQCGSPGAPVSHHSDIDGCTWSYENTVPDLHGSEDLSQFLRLVLPGDYENTTVCVSDADCTTGICGVHPQRWADGSYKGGVEQGSCGEHIAWVTAGGACAGGWEDGEFPDAHPFFCGSEVTGGMRSHMYGCYGTTLAHSGYTPGADTTACGCPEWEEPPYNLTAPPISDCNGINPEWVELSMPWHAHQKRACPTAYTFPYDDQTSTFTCFDGDGPGNPNTQSYTITFCPGDTEENMFG
ncbi:thaumatin-domain containing protein [Ectocarpus siliculosus]|uniref:Thaumatin-domain containing protein n=1 Tax=Ectocarpus siliculosus TaxID=2880 RepID=D7G3V7_ECTSI|nr:thaumatin-domain containing protein [Ectocarpus siliculosus]|eukprot:CBJ33634.1 thaumatin-domain containing protein [Ectocarpus siliculosus]